MLDSVELVLTILEWRETKKKLEALEESIQEAVLHLGETQTVADVRATYSKGRRVFDYKGAVSASDLPEDYKADRIERYTTIIPASSSVDWKAICAEEDLEVAQTNTPTPSVKIKILPPKKDK